MARESIDHDAAEVVASTVIVAPPGFDTPARDSTSYFTAADDHSATVKPGGTLSDLWLVQKNSPTGFANEKEFYAAVLASNPSITDVNSIQAGQTLYLPQSFADGSITYNYANGASINNNAITGEYYMVLPNEDGGQTIYSRVADEFGYTTRQVESDGQGQIASEYVGYQATLDGPVAQVSTMIASDVSDVDWTSLTATYTDGDISSLAANLNDGTAHLLDLITLTPSERQSYGFYTQQEVGSRLGQLGLADANQFMQDGFAAAGAQNAGLNDLQVEIGGTKFIWNNNWADLNLTNGGGWNAAGNGALAAPGAPYCVAPLVAQSILYMGGAETHLSPLVLDLDGDGVEIDLTHAYAGGRVFFDIDADGFAERIGWVKADDGLLAMDVNGNGIIDDITELYGDDQMPAFQKLRGIDANGDGKIDAADGAAYTNLRVWQDANQDGISQADELKTLDSLGIQSISTNDHTDTRWAQENYISSSTTYTRLENGLPVEREIADVHFLNDDANTWYLGAQSQVYGSDVQIDLEAILLPLSRGYGSLPSLHLAMSANPELKRMVRELAYLPLDQMNEAVGRLDDILLEWAGVRGNNPEGHANGEGARIDGRKVDFIEKFTGLTWAQRGTTAMVGEDASVGLKKTWSGIEATLLHRLMAQGALKSVFPSISYDFATDKTVLGDSLANILARAGSLAPQTDTARQDFSNLLGGVLVENREEFGLSLAAVNTAVSTAAGFPLYFGEHEVLPSNFGDPDWGLYTGNGTEAEHLSVSTYVGTNAANLMRGSGAGDNKSRRWRDCGLVSVCANSEWRAVA